jgi:hypothetical protein
VPAGKNKYRGLNAWQKLLQTRKVTGIGLDERGGLRKTAAGGGQPVILKNRVRRRHHVRAALRSAEAWQVDRDHRPKRLDFRQNPTEGVDAFLPGAGQQDGDAVGSTTAREANLQAATCQMETWPIWGKLVLMGSSLTFDISGGVNESGSAPEQGSRQSRRVVLGSTVQEERSVIDK